MDDRSEELAPAVPDYDPLVAVFDTHQESEAMVVRGLLDSAGIPTLIAGREAPQDVLPGVGGVTVRVPPQQAEEARRLIAEYRASGPEPVDDGPDSDTLNEDSAA